MIDISEKEYNHLMWLISNAMNRVYNFGLNNNSLSYQCEEQGLDIKFRKEVFRILK